MNSLRGRRIVVTRPAGQAAEMCRLLEARHAYAIRFPTVMIEPVRNNQGLYRALRQWDSFDWVIFTSVNGVRIFQGEAASAGLPFDRKSPKPAVAAIGPATSRALEENGMRVTAMPTRFVAEGIVDVLGDVSGMTIMLPRARNARRVLVEQLESRGASVVEIPLYDTVDPSPPPNPAEVLNRPVDAVTFTSSSTVEGLLRLLGDGAHQFLSATCVACIGPITANTAREHGVHVDVIASEYTTVGLVDALAEHFSVV